MSQSKKDIRKLSLQEIQDFIVSHGEKAFRAKQIYEWLWNKNAHTFEQMSSLSKE
ncbi:23S rRNA (adenine(2503)-C(2))-methyltransferase RlmN, partial [Ornithobacterium rhinotracheale]|nr:23S rRNA (adenine(2503)-C(2))-methyltransferase RlmN [Ornithobacterium rhinotracheale]